MELRIEADGLVGLPSDCIVSVCCGEVRKQAKYCPSKIFKFPEKQRHGKVDLYKRIGSCDIKIDPDSVSSIVRRVVVEDPSIAGLHLRCLSTPLNTTDTSFSKKSSTGNAKNEAADVIKTYLDEHKISEMLEQAVKALMQERPESPQKFLSDQMLKGMVPKRSDAQRARKLLEDPNKAKLQSRSEEINLETAGALGAWGAWEDFKERATEEAQNFAQEDRRKTSRALQNSVDIAPADDAEDEDENEVDILPGRPSIRPGDSNYHQQALKQKPKNAFSNGTETGSCSLRDALHKFLAEDQQKRRASQKTPNEEEVRNFAKEDMRKVATEMEDVFRSFGEQDLCATLTMLEETVEAAQLN